MRAAVVAVTLALVLSSCGGSGDESDLKPLDTTSPSASATPTSGDPVAPASVKPTRPEDVNSAAGAKAYAIFVMQTIVYTITTNDPDPLLALSISDMCTGCNGLARDVAARGSIAQVPSGDGTISDITVEKRNTDSYVARLSLKVPAGTMVDLTSGEKSGSIDATETELTAVVVWKDDQWRLENYGTPDKETS